MLNVKLEVFEGPFDLLYSLIEKHKIDIYDIPMAFIASEYVKEVEAMEEKDIDNIGEFLIMAATLLKIKSKMLLPLEKDENDEEIDPRLELVTRLLEYKRFKDVCEELRAMEEESGDIAFKGNQKILQEYKESIDYDTFLEGVNMDVLTQAFLKIMKQERKPEEKPDDKETAHHIEETVRKKRVFTVEMQMTHIYDRLSNFDNVKFSELFEDSEDKMEKVMTFLALLEMIKMKKLKVTQDEIFGEINIEKADEFDEGIDFESADMDINVDRIDEIKTPEELEELENKLENELAEQIEKQKEQDEEKNEETNNENNDNN
ncbi:MAG: segregation/condensation protein A [Clostridia bacterium]|nr:segregation/condensation protein A [Clostridia bacterium]